MPAHSGQLRRAIMTDVRPNTLDSNHRTTANSEPSTHETCDPDSALQGYRLHRLEVFNWGTFDGAVHSMTLDGQTTLLVGQNGAGKSTLVDALLTLLVKPGKSRNYNLAAG